MAGKYELKKGTRGQFLFNLKAANGRVILSSEQYTTRTAAQGGIGSVRKHARSDKNFDRRVAKNGQHYFVLKASNGEIIGRSEMYSSTSARENGIKSVRTNGPNTRLDDLT